MLPLFMTVEVSSTEIPTNFVPVFPSILPEFVTSDSLLAKIPAELSPDISIPFATVPLFVTLDFSAIIPTELSPVICIKPVFSAKEVVLSAALSFFT